MKTDASQSLTMTDGNAPLNTETNPSEKSGYCSAIWRSFHLIYLKRKWFRDQGEHRDDPNGS